MLLSLLLGALIVLRSARGRRAALPSAAPSIPWREMTDEELLD